MAKRRRRDNIVLVRRDTPKKVTFAGRSFTANFRRGTRADLPRHITISRPTNRRKKAKNRKKKVPAWLNSIGRKKHARKVKQNALATKKAIKRIVKKKVTFAPEPKKKHRNNAY